MCGDYFVGRGFWRSFVQSFGSEAIREPRFSTPPLPASILILNPAVIAKIDASIPLWTRRLLPSLNRMGIDGPFPAMLKACAPRLKIARAIGLLSPLKDFFEHVFRSVLALDM